MHADGGTYIQMRTFCAVLSQMSFSDIHRLRLNNKNLLTCANIYVFASLCICANICRCACTVHVAVLRKLLAYVNNSNYNFQRCLKHQLF